MARKCIKFKYNKATVRALEEKPHYKFSTSVRLALKQSKKNKTKM